MGCEVWLLLWAVDSFVRVEGSWKGARGQAVCERGYQKKKAEFIQPARCVEQDRVNLC